MTISKGSKAMIEKVMESAKVQEVQHAFREGSPILVEALWNAPKVLLASLAQKVTGKNVLILTGASLEESRLFDDFLFFTECPVIDFPAWETLPSENIPPSPDIVGERYKVLQTLSESKQPHIILSNLQACLQKVIAPQHFQKLYLPLHVGGTFPFSQLSKKLEEMGYTRKSIAADKGEFAVRGGIIDVFPVSSPDPFRIEFWGDEVESIRIYDPIGQKSIREVKSVDITAAQELELVSKTDKLCTILDYLGPDTIVIFDDLLSLEDRYASLVNVSGTLPAAFTTLDVFFDHVESLQKIYLTQTPIEELSEVHIMEKTTKGFYSQTVGFHDVAFQMFNRSLRALRWNHPFVTLSDFLLPETEEEPTGDQLFQALNKLHDKDFALTMVCPNETDETQLQKRILDEKIGLPKATHYQLGYLSSGFVIPDIHYLLLPLTELTHRYKIRRQKQRSTYHTSPPEFYGLEVGAPVVHLNNGIGKYLGIEKKENNLGIESEFFLLEYAEDAKLYVPINQAHLLSKYIGSGEEAPKLHTLGNNRWRKTREHTEKAIFGYAKDLLEIYAKRSMSGGFAYPQDGIDMGLFEEEFPYEETEDQLTAIDAIKQDMISDKSMDRLICGDVGYGKTEVAMRSCFKAVVEGHKQVAVLVPTTVLALQHYENFVDRMSNFPITIGLLSRFQTAKKTKETLEGIEKGSVDIVIGTLRMISKDVKFKNLGLIVIDEEQRFGVRAKEHLKKIKVGVDCLTLSATPIPRTLYMSMIGARDMSVINTPPQDRLPITSIIAEPNDQVLKNALLRELNRDGQAYVIHNRVETIFEMADRIKKLLPQARVVVGHGQMSSDEIDLVFHAFKSGKADILVATTIVENGIDIPNANTILVDRADRFGMADLYQLRGRVGRWNRRAYCYFLVPKFHNLPEISRKRLTALAESGGYGGGMKIAMRDLEIRGAGDILGLEQSGHVSAIGFHLYCKLLKRTIQTLQGNLPRNLAETKMEFPFDARLTEQYISDTGLRLEIYQRLGEVLTFDEVDELWEEILDRFGPAPEPVQWLYYLTRLRIFGSQHHFTLIKFEKLSINVERQKGKVLETRKILFHLPKNITAANFEERVVKTLKNEFKIE